MNELRRREQIVFVKLIITPVTRRLSGQYFDDFDEELALYYN